MRENGCWNCKNAYINHSGLRSFKKFSEVDICCTLINHNDMHISSFVGSMARSNHKCDKWQLNGLVKLWYPPETPKMRKAGIWWTDVEQTITIQDKPEIKRKQVSLDSFCMVKNQGRPDYIKNPSKSGLVNNQMINAHAEALE